MLRKIYFFVGLILLLQSCSSNRLYQMDDEFKNEKKVILTQNKWFNAPNHSIFYKNQVSVFMKWIEQKDKDLQLYMFLTTGVQSQVKDDIFFKIDDTKYHLKFKSIDEKEFADQVSNEHIENVYEEEDKKAEDDKDKKKKRVLRTIVDHHSYTNHYIKIKATVFLSPEIKSKLKKANDIKIQFYINEVPYKLQFNKLDRSKMKKLLE